MSEVPRDDDRHPVLDLQWPDPLVPIQEIKKYTPWLVDDSGVLLAYAPPRLVDVATLVTSRENACRYCYGAVQASMRIFGYRDETIRDLEQEVENADGLTREVVQLARNLARSDPRPARAELVALERHGLSPQAASEIVLTIAASCYGNRVGTFLALKPVAVVEQAAKSVIGRALFRLLLKLTGRATRVSGPVSPVHSRGPLSSLLSLLPESPVTAWFSDIADRTFASGALSERTKLLILGVVSRTMGCPFCETAACAGLGRAGVSEEAVEAALNTLGGQDATAEERRILDWARETVQYRTAVIQRSTRALAAEVPVDKLLEAISTAAISNMAVRMAMLLQ